MGYLATFVGAVIDLVLPPRCPGCGAIVPTVAFCARCWQALDFLDGPGCTLCGGRVAYDGLVCAPCLSKSPDHDGVRAAVAYGEIARTVALKLKYGRRPGQALIIARALAHLVPDRANLVYVPVPLHRWRLWSRGFNQSQLIASRLANLTGHPVNITILKRQKPTPSLRGLSGAERAQAVRSAFCTAADAHHHLAGKTVALVDDVYTSGATANACARALKNAGATRVIVLCWARVSRVDGIMD
jgi:ComF family protein